MSVSPQNRQEFISPADLFEKSGDEITAWTCVRTRPRWEKKFARWLHGQRIPYFLPVYLKTTITHRKKRVAAIPLFPGYVFVADNVLKSDLSNSDAVVRVLKPGSDVDAAILHHQLHSLWIAVQSGQPIAQLAELHYGQRIEIIEGPMRGMEGIYVRNGRERSLVLKVDMLGNGVTIELPPDCRFLVVE